MLRAHFSKDHKTVTYCSLFHFFQSVFFLPCRNLQWHRTEHCVPGVQEMVWWTAWNQNNTALAMLSLIIFLNQEKTDVLQNETHQMMNENLQKLWKPLSFISMSVTFSFPIHLTSFKTQQWNAAFLIKPPSGSFTVWVKGDFPNRFKVGRLPVMNS